MAIWLVLERFSGTSGKVYAAEIIDDAQYDVQALIDGGASIVPYSDAYEEARQLFLEGHDPTDPADEQMSMIPMLSAQGVPPTGSVVPRSDTHHVDSEFEGTSSGSENNPWKTINEALAAVSSPGTVFAHTGTYVEDVAIVDGVDIVGLVAPQSEAVAIVGEVTANIPGQATLQNLQITQGNAGQSALVVNDGSIRLEGCRLRAEAAADLALLVDGGFGAVATVRRSDLANRAGNPNPVARVAGGILRSDRSFFTHADGISGPVAAIDVPGAAFGFMLLDDATVQGAVSLGAGANPWAIITRSRVETGTIAALSTDATTPATIKQTELISAEPNGFAIDGDGAIAYTGMVLSGGAQQIAPSVNGGAGPGADAGYASVKHAGSVAAAQIIQSGQPAPGELLTVGGDVYEADGVGGNINFAIGGSPAATMANLLAAAVANGTEPLLWDAIGATHLRLRSADGPQGNILPADPNVALTEAMTNYEFDCGNVNMNTLAGHPPTPCRMDDSTIVVNAGHVASKELRFSFPFVVDHFDITAISGVTGELKGRSNDVYAIDNGDILITVSGLGADPLVATDIVTVIAFEA